MIDLPNSYVTIKELGKGPLFQVTLSYPYKSGGWNNCRKWDDDICRQWSDYCSEIPCKGFWSMSSSKSKEQYYIHYWFQNSDDAIIFKLIIA